MNASQNFVGPTGASAFASPLEPPSPEPPVELVELVLLVVPSPLLVDVEPPPFEEEVDVDVPFSASVAFGSTRKSPSRLGTMHAAATSDVATARGSIDTSAGRRRARIFLHRTG
ncbi:MAG: hypothetical protein KIT84_25120 [Labilithrix sp.]|nr:hypothetical protein [Labilithrix sp.]MCW5814333.1 hypothetical protein [Labilithrix sp.]